MKKSVATFVILPSDVEADVAGLANAHAAFNSDRRRVIRLAEQSTGGPQAVVAMALSDDGTVCAALTRMQALDEAWIEDGFVRAARGAS